MDLEKLREDVDVAGNAMWDAYPAVGARHARVPGSAGPLAPGARPAEGLTGHCPNGRTGRHRHATMPPRHQEGIEQTLTRVVEKLQRLHRQLGRV